MLQAIFGPFLEILMRTKLVESRQVIYHFKACQLKNSKIKFVRKLFKFRQNLSNYIFREIHNNLLGIVKSEYFAK